TAVGKNDYPGIRGKHLFRGLNEHGIEFLAVCVACIQWIARFQKRLSIGFDQCVEFGAGRQWDERSLCGRDSPQPGFLLAEPVKKDGDVEAASRLPRIDGTCRF